MNEIVDPLLLGLLPPMDLNSALPDKDVISPFPLKLRTRRGIGLFGTRRSAGTFVRMHQATDLLAPRGTPVFPAGSGLVTEGSDTSRLIFHDSGAAAFLTFYSHLQNIAVDIGAPVGPGQQIGEVGVVADSHLHFELRYPFDSTDPRRERSMAIDPTNALYQWEVRTFQNDTETRAGHTFDDVTIASIEGVWRGRLLQFMLVNVAGSSRDLFVPLIDRSPGNLSLIETLKLAFFHARKVRIVWRESLFFGEIDAAHDRAAVIAEVKVR